MLKFFKYHGAGNDFILVDQREDVHIDRADRARIAGLCHRRFGIGADGLILLQQSAGYDFEMVYFNADGGEGTLCGNGARCVVAFAHFLGCIGDQCHFLASDGAHDAVVVRPDWIEVHLRDMPVWEAGSDYEVLNTGSPHYVRFVSDLHGLDIREEGRAVRYSEPFRQAGINVNFVEERGEELWVGTYERGVEDETLACGTGVTAAALAHVRRKASAEGLWHIPVVAKGGRLSVRFTFDGKMFRDVWLCGPAERVFEGITVG